MNIINLIAIVIIIALATLGIVLFELYKRFKQGSFVRGLVVCVAVGLIVGAVIVVAKLISGGLIR